MTITSVKSVFFAPKVFADKKIDLIGFTLPHPSNIESKDHVRLLKAVNKGDEAGVIEDIYQLKSHVFSKGSNINNKTDMANDIYHYTDDGVPLKSFILTNEADRSDSWIIENGDFKYLAKYDITYNLIGFYYKDSVSKSEVEYTKERNQLNLDKDPEENSKEKDNTANRFLTLRDYQDLLSDSHDKNWSNFEISFLQKSLKNVADVIEEAGEFYYQINKNEILEFLSTKVNKIINNFPKSLPLPSETPNDILTYCKILMACNLLISLIPRQAYIELLQYEGNPENPLSVNIKNAIVNYQKYTDSNKEAKKEKELLLKAAMNVGLSNDPAPKKNVGRVIKKPVASKPKVAQGKGAIDGFFKRSK